MKNILFTVGLILSFVIHCYSAEHLDIDSRIGVVEVSYYFTDKSIEVIKNEKVSTNVPDFLKPYWEDYHKNQKLITHIRKHGTAFLIDSSHVMVSAHMITRIDPTNKVNPKHDSNHTFWNYVDGISLNFFYKNKQGTHKIAGFKMLHDPRYFENGWIDYDIGVVKLKDHVNSNEFYHLDAISDKNLKYVRVNQKSITVTGCSLDENGNLLPRMFFGNIVQQSEGDLLSSNSRIILSVLNDQTHKGDSGAPIEAEYPDENGKEVRHVLGIHHGSGNKESVGVRVSPEFLDTVKKFMNVNNN